MKFHLIVTTIFVASWACTPKPQNTESLKREIEEAEQAFNDYALEHGVKKAFLTFAHNEAVINRRDSIISGKGAIENYFDSQSFSKVVLQWKPDFIDVSVGGDMAYTYGKYVFSAMTADSTKVSASGIFHTVWKRDENGEWKYVYD